MEAIDSERAYQEEKFQGRTHQHGVAEYLLIMEKCLGDAKRAYSGNGNDATALDEVRQVVAVGVACMEDHGAPLRRAKRTDKEIEEAASDTLP
jgi:hypothetical protein